ncbi:MAG: FecCD family ABC transporter permease [bacterium]
MHSYSSFRSKIILTGLGVFVGVISLWSLKSGAITTGIRETVYAIAYMIGVVQDSSSERMATIIAQIRLPRLLLGLLVGSGLALCGAVMQALFRNPMADPGLLGVSSGAAFGAVLTIVLGISLMPGIFALLGEWLLLTMAFVGSLVSLLLVYRLARFNNRTDIPTMLLAGVAMNAITGSLIGLLSYIADDAELRDLIFWSLGSLEVTDWNKLLAAALVILPACAAMLAYGGALNANLLGESEARHLGFDIERIKTRLIILVSLVVGVIVAMSGIIGFVGLVVPHLLRLIIGPDHRLLLPASALFGAGLLVTADIVARTAVAPAEVPIGIITAVLGGPLFLWLLIRHKRKLKY